MSRKIKNSEMEINESKMDIKDLIAKKEESDK